MKKRPEAASISNLALAGVATLFIVTTGVLGGLFYSLRSHHAAAVPKVEQPTVIVAAMNPADAVVMQDDNAPVIRLASRKDEPSDAPAEKVAPPAAEAAPIAAPSTATQPPATEKEVARVDEPATALPPASALAAPASATPAKDMSNELIPEIKGTSYTARKALANGGDAYAVNKPPPKKTDAKKVPPTPPTAKVPTKPETPSPTVAKVDPPKAPGLTAAEMAKIDTSKAPVYVLNDGRRLRAVTVREEGMTITIKNEVGATIIFKKADIKEILRG